MHAGLSDLIPCLLLQGSDLSTVRMLPRVHWGANPGGLDHVPPDSPEISVLHHYFGSWKSRGGWVAKAIVKAALRQVWRLLSKFLPQQGIAPSPARSVWWLCQCAGAEGAAVPPDSCGTGRMLCKLTLEFPFTTAENSSAGPAGCCLAL